MSTASRIAAGGLQGGITWAGPGRTAFAVPVALGASRVPSECADSSGISECLGAGFDSPRAQALQDFFAARGASGSRDGLDSGCLILTDERLYDASWIGEDAGPGSCTGVHTLAEIDDVGTIVLCAPGTGSGLARREEAVVDLAARRGEIFFLLEKSQGGGMASGRGPIDLIFPNVAVIDSRRTSIGALAGFLEASDWAHEVTYRTWPAELPAGLEREDVAPLQAWRRRAGLRRSIDLGTRWIVFELSHPILWRSLERDVSAFLYRLKRLGFFTGLKFCSEDCRVECVPSVDSRAEANDSSRLRIRINVQEESMASPGRFSLR